MKKSLSFCSCLGLSAASTVRIKVVQIGIHIAVAACTVAIAHPCFAETVFLVPKQRTIKVENSGLQGGELDFQFISKPCPIPARKCGIEVGKRTSDGGAETSRGGTVSVVTSNTESAKNGN